MSSAYPILLWWSWDCLLYLIIIIKPEVWIINHCLGLGHETMVCAVCLTMFLWGPPGSCRPQVGPMLAQQTFLSGILWINFCWPWGHCTGNQVNTIDEFFKQLVCFQNSYSTNVSFIHWEWNKMEAILKTTFWNWFHSMKTAVFGFDFHCTVTKSKLVAHILATSNDDRLCMGNQN